MRFLEAIVMTQRIPLIAGNWKMHGDRSRARALLDALKPLRPGHGEVAVCVPFPYLELAQGALHGSAVAWGAQNVAEWEEGAHTGEVAASMLADFGCSYVIVGHSERRRDAAEDDASIARKLALAIRHELNPILCIGETLAQRQDGSTNAVLQAQLHGALAMLDTAALARLAIAYEPVWAIGQGQAATPAMVGDVANALRAMLGEAGAAVRLLYGGSVSAANCGDFAALPELDGLLVGGASLRGDEFTAICQRFCAQREGLSLPA